MVISRENNFDFIRFVSACLVIVSHAYPISGRGTNDFIQEFSWGLFPTAHVGVCVFFTISGYLITQSAEHSSSWYVFLWKRLLRLYPALLALIVFTIFMVGAIYTTEPIANYFTNNQTWHYWLVIKLFPPYPNQLPNVFQHLPLPYINHSLWTLAYEFSMYIGVLLLHQMGILKHKKVLFACFLFTWLLAYWLIPYIDHSGAIFPILHLNYAHFADLGIYFFAGIIIYLFREIPVFNKWGMALSLMAWFGLYLIPFTQVLVSPHIMVWFRYLALPYVVFYLAFHNIRLNNFGKHGDFSYGIYIYGFPVQQMIASSLGISTPITIQILLSFAILLPLSYVSWHFIEKKALKFKNTLPLL
jgi:peptidoglycan/LPS O-acetylase OafA/YrhL